MYIVHVHVYVCSVSMCTIIKELSTMNIPSMFVDSYKAKVERVYIRVRLSYAQAL